MDEISERLKEISKFKIQIQVIDFDDMYIVHLRKKGDTECEAINLNIMVFYS